MFPKLQRSRQAHWQRFWRRAPAWAQSQLLSPCILSTGPVALGKGAWRAGRQLSFGLLIPPPPPPRPFNCTAYWATQHNEYPHSFCALFPLFNGISCSCSNASPLLFVASYLSSSPIFICLLSLSDLQGYCMMMLQCMSIWKRWTSC